MSRPLDFVLSEINRVAAELGIDPRKLQREQLLTRSEITHHDLSHLGGLTKLRLDAAHAEAIPPLHDYITERGVQLRTTYVRGLERKLATVQYNVAEIEGALGRVLERHPITVSGLRKNWESLYKHPTERMLNAVISDTHLGVIVDPREVPGACFNWTIASRRFAKLCDQLITYKPEHRKETELMLWLLGDEIDGIIHAISQSYTTPLAEQVVGAAQIMVQMIDRLRHHFRKIHLKCVSGNHDRPTHKGGGRAMSEKWDSFATLLHHMIVQAFRHCDDVTFDIPRTPYVTAELPGGHLAVGTHGDTMMSPGNVGKVVRIDKLQEKVYAIDAAGHLGKRVSVVIVGHVHTPMSTMLANGCEVVINGSLSGIAAYAQAIDIHADHPTSVIFESTPDFAVGDFRKVRMKDADNNASYDDIISPPSLSLDHAA